MTGVHCPACSRMIVKDLEIHGGADLKMSMRCPCGEILRVEMRTYKVEIFTNGKRNEEETDGRPNIRTL